MGGREKWGIMIATWILVSSWFFFVSEVVIGGNLHGFLVKHLLHNAAGKYSIAKANKYCCITQQFTSYKMVPNWANHFRSIFCTCSWKYEIIFSNKVNFISWNLTRDIFRKKNLFQYYMHILTERFSILYYSKLSYSHDTLKP